MRCVVDGCEGYATGPPVVFAHVPVLLCAAHRGDYTAHPQAWDGGLDPLCHRVERMWKRSGSHGSGWVVPSAG
jgi:hypothetical protein